MLEEIIRALLFRMAGKLVAVPSTIQPALPVSVVVAVAVQPCVVVAVARSTGHVRFAQATRRSVTAHKVQCVAV